jgi:protein required for attachment to host cells
MNIPKGAIVAVSDGETLNLFRNAGEESAPKLTALPDADVSTENKGSGGRHQSSSANPSDSQQASPRRRPRVPMGLWRKWRRA